MCTAEDITLCIILMIASLPSQLQAQIGNPWIEETVCTETECRVTMIIPLDGSQQWEPEDVIPSAFLSPEKRLVASRCGDYPWEIMYRRYFVNTGVWGSWETLAVDRAGDTCSTTVIDDTWKPIEWQMRCPACDTPYASDIVTIN